MRLGILTSVEARHRYFVRALRERCEVVAVGYEETGYQPATILPADLSDTEARIVTDHFAERTRQEERFFGAALRQDPQGMHSERPANRDEVPNARPASDLRRWQIPPGTLNSAATLRYLESAGVDTLVVYGTNLVRQPLLSRFAGRILNMHLGLSPYYRGTATNFYPLLNEEPEYVGATIHLIDAGIDSGPIFRHARPDIVADDRPHTIGCKAILAGIDAMIAVLQGFQAGTARPVPQWMAPNARLYLRKDYHPRQVVELYRKLDAGLIPRYVQRAEAVRNRLRLLERADQPVPA